jgi:diaminobutyrate-2-oxoglutarate transaminase
MKREYLGSAQHVIGDMCSTNFNQLIQQNFRYFKNAQHEFGKQLWNAGLHFEGKPYPVSLRPLLISAEQAQAVRLAAQQLFNILEKAARLYHTERSIRDIFRTYRNVDNWLRVLPDFRPLIRVCRFDGVVDSEGVFKILETNTACPGGVIQNGIAARMWNEFQAQFDVWKLREVQTQPLVNEPHLFVKQLLETHKLQFGTLPNTAAIVNLHGRYTNEVDWMSQGLLSLGVETYLVDACNLHFDGHMLKLPTGQAVSLTYNKLDPLELMSEPAIHEYLEAVLSGKVCFVNPLLAQWILEDKMILALLSDPRFADHFTSSERTVIAKHVPWTRILTSMRTTSSDGSHINLLDFVIRQRHQLVLKPANLTRGEGVIVGPDVDQSTWVDAVSSAVKSGSYIVQQYIPLPGIDVFDAEANEVKLMIHGLDVYLFGGHFAGFQSRASLDSVVNIGKRGMLLPVIISERGELR